ncbi:transcription factor E2F7 [Pelodytes ibericus]
MFLSNPGKTSLRVKLHGPNSQSRHLVISFAPKLTAHSVDPGTSAPKLDCREIMNCLTLSDLVSTKKYKGDPVIDGRSAHKENMFDRFRISPRAPLKTEPIDLSKQKCFSPERVPVTPVKIDRPPAEPWTPTANLKMLISVASPEIRDREKKKELFRPIENNNAHEAAGHDSQFDVDEMELEKRPSRKQKSLGLLCKRFLSRYPSYPMSTEKMTISVDEAASNIGVERRRIYDIVNVLESLHLVSRVAKNQYCWNGQCNLNDTLRRLQMDGEKQKYEAQIAYFQNKDLRMQFNCGEQKKELSVEDRDLNLEFSEADCPSASISSRKDKSLRIMSKKFVMLFLVSTTKIITLEIAAKIMIEESQDSVDHSKFKTKVRRLYDIANVLTSLGLIKKVHVTEERGRKSAFKWIGPVDFEGASNQSMEVISTSPSPDSKRESSVTGQSCNKVLSFNTAKRKICSEPCSPHKIQKVCIQRNKFSTFAGLPSATGRQTEDTKAKTPATMGSGPGSLHSKCNFNSASPASESGPNNKVLPPLQSNVETSNHGFLPNQPYMYLPSNSVLMLCGNLTKERTFGGSESGFNGHTTRGSLQEPGSQSQALEHKIPAVSTDDTPLSLVPPKSLGVETSVSHQLKSELDELEKSNGTGTLQNDLQKECKTTMSCLKRGEHVSQENMQPSALPQYLYVPPAGLNGFNVLLPADQAAGALGISQSHLASLNFPYVMVPSTALAAFPLFCSHTVPNALPSNGLPECINTNLPNMPSHFMVNTPSVLPSQHSPQLRENPSPLHASSASKESPCLGQPTPITKIQKSPSPSTPKNIRPLHKDTFFKTPGSMQASSAFQKSEGAKMRSSSSAQRRLEIGNIAGE